jgi:hypothetical protein
MGISTYQDYIKKLEQERFESDIREAHEVLQHMGSRLLSLEKNDQSAWKPRRDGEWGRCRYMLFSCNCVCI